MDRMLYVAMGGARQAMLAQALNAHNLANVSTTGFRADLLALSGQPISGPGYPSRVQVLAQENGVNLTPGALTTTGRSLDVAVNGAGWIAVQAPDGAEGYTRAGDLRITPNGALVNGAGRPVIGNDGGPIAIPPAETVEIGVDGTISIRPVGQTPEALVIIDRIKLVNPEERQLAKGGDGLMRLRSGVTADPDAAVSLVPGALEASNVNAVDAMINMIALARTFEMDVKLMKVAEENDRASAQVMRIT